ncbi:PACE efflux transporter [Ferrimonas balearica]|uniref:PACE efflux transporter n=1 Tax=Ferrimonas balearica TaxID=44012 RepID=UPI001C999C8A|nr:PACE efflux transporter [Ferrimonas balearica]MBY5921584.1 PACE efflux transporter [Ferrimonas balearica]MBY5995076.1 PACE efflux transporter [Ferrimonas balearica]
MTTRERLFHSLMFELIALAIVVPVGILFTGAGAGHMTATAVALSLAAVVWNYIYNLMFDRVFGVNRLGRGWGLRVGHGMGFEAGLLAVTIPVLMWSLDLSFIDALILDIGFVVFFLIYAIIYNWGYDQLRARLERQGRLAPLGQ